MPTQVRLLLTIAQLKQALALLIWLNGVVQASLALLSAFIIFVSFVKMNIPTASGGELNPKRLNY